MIVGDYHSQSSQIKAGCVHLKAGCVHLKQVVSTVPRVDKGVPRYRTWVEGSSIAGLTLNGISK